MSSYEDPRGEVRKGGREICSASVELEKLLLSEFCATAVYISSSSFVPSYFLSCFWEMGKKERHFQKDLPSVLYSRECTKTGANSSWRKKRRRKRKEPVQEMNLYFTSCLSFLTADQSAEKLSPLESGTKSHQQPLQLFVLVALSKAWWPWLVCLSVLMVGRT